MRTFVFGDTHGTGEELLSFIKEHNVNLDKDRIIFVGDLFDRGFHSHLIWDLIKRYDIKATLGNHELKYIKWLNREKSSVPPHYIWALNNLINNGVSVEDFYNYISSLPKIINLNNGYIVAHAGVNIDNPLEEDESYNVYGKQNPLLKMPIPKENDGNDYWWDHYDKDLVVLYGHLCSDDNLPRIKYNSRQMVNSIGLDTATVHGGPLTSFYIEENKTYQYSSGIDWFSKLKKEMRANPPIPHPDILYFQQRKKPQ